MSARSTTPSHPQHKRAAQFGGAMIEVLVSMLIVSFGIMGMLGMQTQATVSQMESYQRAQALVLVKDMAQRMEANRSQVTAYLANDIGTGAAQDCTALTTTAARDLCEWAAQLQGAAEVLNGDKVGTLISARGCISQPDPVSSPQVYMVAVVWQGLRETGAPVVECGKDAYSSEAARRAATVVVQMSVLS
ncbi:type IV pilus modification protein PilV [Curvibacter sp. PAE-UM]|uniref:type IV pilus modification protein PilV n=1 Tax=Curvibacter sp. PAE-UM TaxID=1714344 RepID=UPI0009E80AAF|nr:type IV pilus modification protein PilV [Curvibacter sp. PAE-UM]